MLELISKIPEKRSSWATLWLSALVLEVIALYFQYAMDLKPCVMCIYQRTAVLGILFAGLIPFISNNSITRFIGFAIWGVSSIWGMLIAKEHVGYQTDPFFGVCEIVPNFPGIMPLHDWLPFFFGAPGDCGNIDWQFLSFSMPQWMIILFAGYALVFIVVLLSRLIKQRAF